MQQNLFTEGEMTTSRPTITKPNVSRSAFYHGDCLVEMDKIADKSIDMILCDLPYGITRSEIDKLIPFNLMWHQLNRIIKNRGAIVLFGNEPFSSALRMSNIKNYKHEWKWDKIIGSGFQIARYRPMLRSEDVIVFSYNSGVNYYPIMTKRDTPINGYATNNSISNVINNADKKRRTYEYKNPTNILKFRKVKETIHPTQKPVELMEYLIKTYTNEIETVLDFTMGSGTTGVACRNTNRHFIGIEQDKKYFDIAVKRVSEYCG